MRTVLACAFSGLRQRGKIESKLIRLIMLCPPISIKTQPFNRPITSWQVHHRYTTSTSIKVLRICVPSNVPVSLKQAVSMIDEGFCWIARVLPLFLFTIFPIFFVHVELLLSFICSTAYNSINLLLFWLINRSNYQENLRNSLTINLLGQKYRPPLCVHIQ